MSTQIEEITDVMSATEKNILRNIVPESEPLPYPIKPLAMSIGPDAQEYIIPKKDKEKVLNALYPFTPTPKIDGILYCLHESKNFKVRDFKVIREDNRNYLVSPYYANSGGMIIDWISEEQSNSDVAVLFCGSKDANAVIASPPLA